MTDLIMTIWARNRQIKSAIKLEAELLTKNVFLLIALILLTFYAGGNTRCTFRHEHSCPF